MSAPNSFALSKSVDVIMIFKIIKGRSVARCPEPRYLINKLIKQQEQIYHLQL